MQFTFHPDMFVYTFKDGTGNSNEIVAPNKTKARLMAKGMDFGGGAFRYESHRPETKDERTARIRRNREAAEKRDEASRTAPKPMGKRRRYRRNDKCPCGSGKKVKHCCVRKGVQPKPAEAS